MSEPTRDDVTETDPRLLSPLTILTLAVAGFALGFGVLLLDANHTNRSHDFVNSAGFVSWATLIGAQTAYWAIIFRPLWIELRRFSEEWRSRKGETLAIGGFSTLVLAIVPLLTLVRPEAPSWPLAWHSPKIVLLSLIAVLAIGAPAICGISLARSRVLAISPAMTTLAIEALLKARADIRRFLAVAGALVGLATLSIGALQRAVVPDYLSAREVPPESVLIYGGFLTAVLLVTYVPAQFAMTIKGEQIRDQMRVTPDPELATVSAWLVQRKNVEDALRLGEGPSQTLQSALFIVTPLLASVFSLLIPTG